MDLDPTNIQNNPQFEDYFDRKLNAEKSELKNLESIDLSKAKNPQRLQYEAEVAVIKRQLGSLENIRIQLGLSQRKICQLLMVDPSCWTRWQKNQNTIPPSVWRSLQWYMILQDKIPGLNAQYFLGWKDSQHIENIQESVKRQIEHQNQQTQTLLQAEKEKQNAFWQWRLQDSQSQLKAEIFSLQQQIRKQKQLFWLLGFGIFVLLSFFIGLKAHAEQGSQRSHHHWLPFVYYTPETQIAYGLLSVVSFVKSESKPSTLISSLTHTTLRQSIFSISPQFVSDSAKYEWGSSFYYNDYPHRYYSLNLKDPIDNYEKYRENNLIVSVNGGWNFWQQYYLRSKLSYENLKNKDVSEEGLLAQEWPRDFSSYHDIKMTSLNVSLERDTRNYMTTPTQGALSRLSFVKYQTDFIRWEIEQKNYLQYNHQIWASQFLISEVYGSNIPFMYLNSIGGGDKLRGYYRGRYRTQSLSLAQTEVRQMINTRWTLAAFAGVGRMGPTLNSIFTGSLAKDLASFGLGAHYMFSPESRTKIRFDIGWASKGLGLYILLGEAF